MTSRIAIAVLSRTAAIYIVSGATACRDAEAPEPLALFTAEGGPVDPGDPPTGLSGVSSDECESCHPAIVREWSRSAHARSWVDPIFQAEYAEVQSPFCRHCHAPLARDASERAAARRGIDCAVCHVREQRILGPRGHGGDAHASLRVARMAASEFCAPCHQFEAASARHGVAPMFHPGQLLQRTFAEWEQSRSARAGSPCQDCHMPTRIGLDGRPYRSHAFPGLGDARLRSRAVEVDIAARREGGVTIVSGQLIPRAIGHAFPTGDMFREAVLSVTSGDVGARERFTRHFAPTITADGTGHLLREVRDTRVPPPGVGAARRFRFVLPNRGQLEVSWSLDVYRMSLDAARRRGIDEARIRVPVHEGRIPVQ